MTGVGKVAPPMPTMPASRMMPTASLGVRLSGFAGGLSSIHSSLKSFSTTTASTSVPLKVMVWMMSTTVPETEECTGAETKAAASPSFWPTRTGSPLATITLAGAPPCWDMGITTRLDAGSSVMGLPPFTALPLRPSCGWIPPGNRRFPNTGKIPPPYESLPKTANSRIASSDYNTALPRLQ